MTKGDPHGYEPAIPRQFSPLMGPDGAPLPCAASNDLTVFAILDTGDGSVTSDVFDTADPFGVAANLGSGRPTPDPARGSATMRREARVGATAPRTSVSVLTVREAIQSRSSHATSRWLNVTRVLAPAAWAHAHLGVVRGAPRMPSPSWESASPTARRAIVGTHLPVTLAHDGGWAWPRHPCVGRWRGERRWFGVADERLVERVPGRPERRARWRRIAVRIGVTTLVLAAAVAWGVAALRVPPGDGVLQRPLPVRQAATVWALEPSYAFDALCVVQALSGDPYYLALFEGTGDEAFARDARARLSRAERAAVDRLYGVLHRSLGTVPCAVLSSLLAITGNDDLDAFRASLADPRGFRRSYADELDVFYRRTTGGLRLPGPVVDLLLRDVATYLDALERIGFGAYWETSVRPDLEALAGELARGVTGYDVVSVVETLIGGGLPSDRLVVHLARFARPNGISLGATALVMEERTDARHLVRVTAHELLHGWVDWTDAGALEAWLGSLRRDPVVARAFEGRDRHHGYNSYLALAEEGLTQALDQLASERLGVASDPLERWFFHDGGLHVLGLAWYEALRGEAFDVEPRSIHARATDAVAAGVVAPGRVAAAWEAAFARPCAFDQSPTLATAYVSGDPALLAIHPSYAGSVPRGTLIVFLAEWCVDDDPQAVVARLEAAARAWDASVLTTDGRALPLTPLYGGNWSVERDGLTHLYRHALTYRWPAGVAADELAEPLEVRFTTARPR